ncbi:MAG: cysteine peptidase family C39 domain-containing protein [Planctomycetales bacterium]|jgi:hypothetical protein
MADLYVGMVILAVISLFVLIATVGLTRDITKREATAVGVVVALLLLCYLRFIWKSSVLADYLPYSSIVVLSNWFPPAAAFLAGITWTHGYGSKLRRVLFGGILFGTSCWSVASPIVGKPPVCENIWDKHSVCRQTSRYTCTPAAAAMLLTWHGIPAEESEMAELCLTRKGTTWQGLFRGLTIKTRDQPFRVRVVECEWDELPEKLTGPSILSVGIDPSKPYPEIYTKHWGWMPGVRHSVMLRDVSVDGRFSIADPAVGAESWRKEDVQTLFRGRFLTLEPTGEFVASRTDGQN